MIQNDTKLKDLILSEEGITPNFNPDIYKYELIITKEISQISLDAIPYNSTDKIEILGNNNLKQGKNIILIKVISNTNNAETIYTINLLKTDDINKVTTNLENLFIENNLLNIPFDKNILNYNIEISNKTDFLNIIAIPESEEAYVEIKGSNNLINGNNLVEIIVTSSDKSNNKTYTINVYKRNNEEERIYNNIQNINENKLKEIYNYKEINYTTNKLNLEQKIQLPPKLYILLIMLLIILLYVIIKKKNSK